MGEPMRFQYDDGGRKSAGFKGAAGDCVVRAIAIATETPYADVYRDLGCAVAYYSEGHRDRVAKRVQRKGVSVRDGVSRKVYEEFLAKRGWKWTPTMQIGSGCRVHLTDGELPMGRIVVKVSRHLTAVIDGVIHDTHDSQRRCVYGYYSQVPPGCLHGSTRIYDPVVGDELTIQDRWRNGQAFHVWSMSGPNSAIVACAKPPQQFAPQRMARVLVENCEPFIVTLEHRFYVGPDEWITASKAYKLLQQNKLIYLLSGDVLDRKFPRVLRVDLLGEEPYYDFHVPVFNNYWAGGLWHHNCGKTLYTICAGNSFNTTQCVCGYYSKR